MILGTSLNLPRDLYNYANPDLPQHYRSGEALEFDNTPEENPVTDMGATLGRVLFYDKKLSANNSVSCASCHEQSAAFSDNRTFSVGLNGEKTARNSMSLINSRYYENGRFMWDERAATLEEQVLIPIQDHVEMGMDLKDLTVKLQDLDYYNLLFDKTFGTPEVTKNRIALALAQFTRSIVSYNSKFDKALVASGSPPVDEKMPLLSTLTQEEQLGMNIFLRGRNGATCGYCHGTAQMVNDEAKNNGLSMFYDDQGKGKVTLLATDMALFKVPSLKNIAKTAPYMHDGRFQTLMEVIDHYSDNVQAHPNLNFRLTTLDDGESGTPYLLKLNLNQQEKEALVAFLHTLTDEQVLTDPKFSDPFKQ
ncbi:MAG: cytochrome c peroxidase [Roseivirga sp.]